MTSMRGKLGVGDGVACKGGVIVGVGVLVGTDVTVGAGGLVRAPSTSGVLAVADRTTDGCDVV